MTNDTEKHATILGVQPQEFADRALVVGDPDRVTIIAEQLEDVREIGRHREYVTLVGSHRGVPVTVASHGVGASGAAICFEGLARGGVKRFVRAGTCGGLQEGVVAGDLVVGTAAARDDGLTDRLTPIGWPAVADPALTLALTARAEEADLASHVGVVHTAANFYPSTVFDQPGWKLYHRAGAVAIEMEFSVLLVIAMQHGAQAGGIFAVDGNLLADKEDMSDYDPHQETVVRAKQSMIDIALDVLVADS